MSEREVESDGEMEEERELEREVEREGERGEGEPSLISRLLENGGAGVEEQLHDRSVAVTRRSQHGLGR